MYIFSSLLVLLCDKTAVIMVIMHCFKDSYPSGISPCWEIRDGHLSLNFVAIPYGMISVYSLFYTGTVSQTLMRKKVMVGSNTNLPKIYFLPPTVIIYCR